MTGVPRFVGIPPRFPWPFQNWTWWNEAIPAERMAALRIAAATALIIDLVLGLLPGFASWFSNGGAGFQSGTLLDGVPAPLAFGIWFVAAVALLVGYRPLFAGLICWAGSVTFAQANPWITNGGDQVRSFLLFAVALGRTGAVWGVQSVRRGGETGPVYVPGWPAKLVVVYWCCMYFFSGVYKGLAPDWQSGQALMLVLQNRTWSRLPELTSVLPIGFLRAATWFTILWELAFPIAVFVRRTRRLMLALGIAFHLATLVLLEIGTFALYGLAGYFAFGMGERRPRRVVT
jgi:hypothetical protein